LTVAFIGEVDQTLDELLATGHVVRRWDEARGWVYHLTEKGDARFEELRRPRAPSPVPAAHEGAIRLLLEMSGEMARLFSAAEALLWSLDVPDIDMVKQLRLMFTNSTAAARARDALSVLEKPGC